MPKPVKQVTDMVIDEISLVDRPANPHAQVIIAKRATQEDAMPDFFTADGAPVDVNALQYGDVVYDGDANEYEYVAEDDDTEDDDTEDAKELVGAGVAKSAFGAATAPAPVTTDPLAALRQELSKALTEEDRDKVLSKALDQVSVFEQRASQAEAIAKGERDLRLEREYISKAAEYNVPIEPTVLGPVLMRMADNMSYEDCAVVHKALTTVGEILFRELGYEGNADNVDPFQQVEAYLEEQGSVAKSAGNASVNKAQSIADFYTNNPAAYDQYVAGLGR